MTVVHAPLAGRVVSLTDVPDPVFSGQIVGAGKDMKVLPFDDVAVARECAS